MNKLILSFLFSQVFLGTVNINAKEEMLERVKELLNINRLVNQESINCPDEDDEKSEIEIYKNKLIAILSNKENPKNRLELFQKFTMAIAKSGIKSDEHLDAWGDLAKAYLDLAKTANLSEEDKKIAKSFKREIEEKRASNKLTYEWFVLFNDRLSILLTNEINRKNKQLVTDNTGHGEYKKRLMNHKQPDGSYSWLTDEGYRDACNKVINNHLKRTDQVSLEQWDSYLKNKSGTNPSANQSKLDMIYNAYKDDNFVAKNSSPLGLAKRTYPDYVMMPYPYELDVNELLMSTPSPGKQNFWALGSFIPKDPKTETIYADGFKMAPAHFMTHDMFHLIIVKSELDMRDVFFLSDNKPAENVMKNLKDKAKRLNFEALEWAQELVKIEEEKQPIDPDKIQMAKFFGFLFFHEGAQTGTRDLFEMFFKKDALVDSIGKNNFPLVTFNQLVGRDLLTKEAKQYADALPKSLEDLSSNKEKFWNKFIDYGEEYIRNFQENPELITKLQHWVNSFDTMRKKHPAVIVARASVPFYDQPWKIPDWVDQDWYDQNKSAMPENVSLVNSYGTTLKRVN